MDYYFDMYGWLTDVVIPDRKTTIVPPAPEGNKKPNFTGIEWLLLDYNPPTGQQNAEQADAYLSSSDWTSIPAVADPLQSDPYLMNQADWLAYRNILRNISIKKIEGYIQFPTPPNEIWSEEK